MNRNYKKLSVFGGVALIVLVLDQLTKYWIRTTPELHRFTLIEGWLAFNYTKNPGMAMGIHWADTWIISLIAIVATILILYYVWKTLKPAGMGYMVCMGLIIGGALGNISDRLFMAIVGGYGGMLDGHVVDFIHFKLSIGGFDVFPYIFNVADSAITIAIISLIVFYRKIVPDLHSGGENPDPDAESDRHDSSEDTGRKQAAGQNRPANASGKTETPDLFST